MSVEDHTVSYSLEVNVERAYEDVRRLQTVFYRTLGLLSRMGLPEDVEAAMARIQRLIAMLNTLRLTAIAAYTAQGPYGYAFALIGLATFALDVGDFVMDL